MMIIMIITTIVLFFGTFIFNFSVYFVLFVYSREECQPMDVYFLSPLKGEVTVKFKRFN